MYPTQRLNTQTYPTARFKFAGTISQLDLLLLAILLGPVTRLTIGGKTPNLFWADIVVVLLSAAFVLRSLVENLPLQKIPKIVYFYLAYLTMAFGTLFFAEDLPYSIAVFKLHLMPLVVFVLALNLLRTERDIRHLIISLQIFGGLLALMMFINWNAYNSGELTLEKGYGLKDFAQVSWGRDNYLASIFSLLILPCLSVLSVKRPLSLIVGGCSVGLMTFALIFCLSRGALICLAAGTLVWFLVTFYMSFQRRMFARPFVMLAALAGLFVFAYFRLPKMQLITIQKHMQILIKAASSNPESDSRVKRWEAAWSGFTTYPWFGIGLGNQIAKGAEFHMKGSAHNLYLETLLETGIFSFLALMGFLVGFGLCLIKLWRVTKEMDQRLVCGLIGAFVTVLINAFEEPSFWGLEFAYVFWIIMALSYTLLRLSKGNSRRDSISLEQPEISSGSL